MALDEVFGPPGRSWEALRPATWRHKTSFSGPASIRVPQSVAHHHWQLRSRCPGSCYDTPTVYSVSLRGDRANVASQTGEGSVAEEWVREAAVACVDPANNGLPVFIDRVGRELPGDTA